MNDSWYRASVPAVSPRAQLQGGLEADVCIVGAGFTGLSAALELAEAGRSVIVLEAEDVGWGCSGRNGGQINPGLACEHARVVRELGEADARKVWQLGLDGVDLLRDRVARHDIDCDLKWGILLVANKARQVPDLHAWQQELGELGYDRLEFHDREALQGLLRADYHAGVMDWGGGDLHPLKYAQGLSVLPCWAMHKRGARLRCRRRPVRYALAICCWRATPILARCCRGSARALCRSAAILARPGRWVSWRPS